MCCTLPHGNPTIPYCTVPLRTVQYLFDAGLYIIVQYGTLPSHPRYLDTQLPFSMIPGRSTMLLTYATINHVAYFPLLTGPRSLRSIQSRHFPQKHMHTFAQLYHIPPSLLSRILLYRIQQTIAVILFRFFAISYVSQHYSLHIPRSLISF